eukprot:6334186-Pyramimonas_sp.AAC.1
MSGLRGDGGGAGPSQLPTITEVLRVFELVSSHRTSVGVPRLGPGIYPAVILPTPEIRCNAVMIGYHLPLRVT